jgi:hypothetical protein
MRIELEFEVEHLLSAGGRTYVLARALGGRQQFEIANGSTLAGCDLEPYVDIPRALAPDGMLRDDLFSFALARPEDALRLSVGQLVRVVAFRQTTA